MTSKILHLPTSTGGNSIGLSTAEKLLGYDSKILTLSSQFNQYPADIDLKASENPRLINLINRLTTFFKVRNQFDVYHFNFGTTLLDLSRFGIPLADLPFYKKNAKKIVTYNGCDIRQKYPTMNHYKIAACHEKACYNGQCNSGELDKIRRLKIKKMQQYVDKIFAVNPDLIKFLPEGAEFLPYTIANWDKIKKPSTQKSNKALRIVHAPTNRAAKGSKYVESALNKLSKKYNNIDIIFVENKTHEEALNIYKTADLVIDQVLIGWYGAFAVEVMKMGIPVACYIREEDLIHIPEKMRFDLADTIINIDPFSIEEKIGHYLENPNLLKDKAQAALDYVHYWHNPIRIAKYVAEFY